ncbi:MAG: hypothetical protein KKF85_08595 [Gammaproteobacteria bacterium]|nr:hypothetical protein [Rhodocyclaceae bacterium]MBU3910258.1 hypothetical protein [Gammaproteobacteria bacterium]MBU3989453.1 hypothetical protein [Gammaproteobacteria bacterium]MBU4005428.1 hypothetical protein [Gammaproteobacteria bacterium]MBU4022720.1 hypothetical protein [Gammaproteobacteria bacterium]
MLKIRHTFIALAMLVSFTAVAEVQVSIGIGLPHASIGINLPAYPQLVRVPGYPVYYAPGLAANFFFYDSMFWVYQDDNWYASSWYNGPWGLVGPAAVPVFVLRIPVRYYRQPPPYFRAWRSDAPPRWGDHWGHDWQQQRRGWDKWNRNAAPPPAPLPKYQRQYSGDRYPQQVEQQELQKRNYRYQPRDPVVKQHYQERAEQRAPARKETRGAPQERDSRQQDIQRSMPHQQGAPVAPRMQSQQRGGEDMQRSPPASSQPGRPEVQERRQPPQPALDPRGRDQQMPRTQGREERQQGQDATREPKRKGQEPEKERGRGRNE